MMSKLIRFLTGFLVLLSLGCNRPISSSPTPDLFATLQASTPSGFASPAVTPNATSGGSIGGSQIPVPSGGDELTGHIVFTCQLFKVQAMDQVCIMNADGSGMRRLTTENNRRHLGLCTETAHGSERGWRTLPNERVISHQFSVIESGTSTLY